MKSHFKDLIQYNNWANQRYFDVIDEHKIKDDEILRLYSHILSAQIVWLLRIQGLPTSPFPLWERYNVVELKSMLEESGRNWVNHIDSHPLVTFEEMISYKNSKGEKFESTIREIISHILTHGSYHRGQLALLMRKLGIDPPITDFIIYRRLK